MEMQTLTKIDYSSPSIDYSSPSRSNDNPKPALVEQVIFSDGLMQVSLRDRRIITIPLDWFPALVKASDEQLACHEICNGGRDIFWTEIGLALSAADLLVGGNPCENCWYRVSYFK